MQPGFGPPPPAQGGYGYSTMPSPAYGSGGVYAGPAYGSYPQGPSRPPPPSNQQSWYMQYYGMLPPQEIEQLSMWFRTIDQDRSGSITTNELTALKFGGRPMDSRTANKLIRVFDKDQNGSIDFIEFAVMYKFLTLTIDAFHRADYDRSGSIEFNEMRNALRETGFNFSDATISALFRTYSARTETAPSYFGAAYRPPSLTLSCFVDMVVDLAVMKSRFEARDALRRGYVELNFEQAAQMCASI